MSRDDRSPADAAPEPGASAAPRRRRWRVSRRGFLIGAGVVGAGVALGWRFGLPELRLAIAQRIDAGGAPGGVDAPPDAWFELTAEGTTLYLPKVEMGQGIHTALAQIAAEELELPVAELTVRQAPTSRGLRDGFGTGASNSVSTMYTPLREAALALREALRVEAARRWGVDPSQTWAQDGAVHRRDGGTSLSYAELAAGMDAWEVPDELPAFKPAREHRVIGRSVPRVDFASKLTGQPVYGYDQRVPGMVYGAVARPPRIGAELVEAGPGDAAAQPGVVAVVIEDGFAGVVADSRLRARRALDRLELRWTEPEPVTQARVEALTTVGENDGVVVQREGNAPRELRRGVSAEAEYRTPMAAHAHLEPQAALVDVRDDGVRAWVSTQSPDLVQGEIAELLGRDRDQVDLTATFLGGGFGRRLNVVVALEAARLSRAAGRPVHVGWTREEEFRHGYVRPPTHHRLRARLDETGRIAALEHRQASGDVAFGFFPAVAARVLGADFGAWRGAMVPYGGIPNRRTVAERVALPVPTGWWRGLGLLANTFAVEGFVDELAHRAGRDPLDYRLEHLGDDPQDRRFRAVLESVAEMSGWRDGAPEGRARGVAIATDVKTVVAMVAEVSVDDGVRVHRVWCAMDPGLVINPDGAAAQAQGSVVMGLSSTLVEALTVEDGNFAPANFDRYPLLRIDETPEIEVRLLESGDEPFGLGEPPLGPVAAAVANAVFAATGTRLRELPLRI